MPRSDGVKYQSLQGVEHRTYSIAGYYTVKCSNYRNCFYDKSTGFKFVLTYAERCQIKQLNQSKTVPLPPSRRQGEEEV
jgi:hypothetical protein